MSWSTYGRRTKSTLRFDKDAKVDITVAPIKVDAPIQYAQEYDSAGIASVITGRTLVDGGDSRFASLFGRDICEGMGFLLDEAREFILENHPEAQEMQTMYDELVGDMNGAPDTEITKSLDAYIDAVHKRFGKTMGFPESPKR